MHRTWLRWTLKILLVYLLACVPDMVKLALLGGGFSVTGIIFILLAALTSPWLYLFRMFGGELAYFPAFAPFLVILVAGLAVAWWTEHRHRSETKK